MSGPRVLLVAAETSGDMLGAGLARALRRRLPGVELVGVGGPQMAAEGIESPFDIGELSVLGLVEGLMAYPLVKARVRDALAFARRTKPDIAVLIDSWGFTLRVAQGLKRLDPSLPVVKFVGPQVWASRPGRARTLAATVDHLLSILPFDAPHYEPLGLPVTFVGNPTLSRDFSGADAGRGRALVGATIDQPILLVLPGSRPGEVKRLMAPFGEAAARLKASHPDLVIAIPVAAAVAPLVGEAAAAWPCSVQLVEGDEARYDLMKAASVALACSGTVSTELGLAGAPMVIGYRIGEISYRILKRLIRTRWITLMNIASDAEIVPEFIQHDCTGEKLAGAVALLLDDGGRRQAQVAAQDAALARMGRSQADPYGKAAEVVAGLLRPQP